MGTDSSSRTLLGWWLKQKLGCGRSLVREAFLVNRQGDAIKENCQILLTGTEAIVG